MKALIFTTFILALGTAFGFAQTIQKLGIKKVEKNEVPVLILSSAERDFPAETYSDWVIWSNSAFNKHYMANYVRVVKQEEGTNYYQMTRIGNDTNGFAVYDPEGVLIHSRLILENTQLPRPIVLAITKKYLGWSITGDREVIKIPSEASQSFSFAIESGNEKRRLLMAEDGKFIKDIEVNR